MPLSIAGSDAIHGEKCVMERFCQGGGVLMSRNYSAVAANAGSGYAGWHDASVRAILSFAIRSPMRTAVTGRAGWRLSLAYRSRRHLGHGAVPARRSILSISSVGEV